MTEQSAEFDELDYDVTVVGGGPAGLTAALYATRLGLDTAVVNRGGGRAAMMRDTHNVVGVTEDTTGAEFLQTAQRQVREYGADYRQAFVDDVEPLDDAGSEGAGDDGAGGFRVSVDGDAHTSRRVVLATGFSDERPDPPLPPTGRGLHYCLHCDAYMFVDEPVFVMGTGDSAAYVAMIMLNVTGEVDLLTRGAEPTWSDETAAMLDAHPVDVIDDEIAGMNKDDEGWLESFEFEDGTVREYRGGFPMYGSNYNADLADALELDRNDDGTVAVDDHGRTSVDGVYAVGDLTPGHNQIPVAMGEGAKAGIALHMDLRAFPRSVEEIEAAGPVGTDEVPAISPDLLATAVAHPGHAAGPRAEEASGSDGESETVADD
ncbi:NAD(P)/FAD-dependent oxidoreductase [Candidatus Halobonum tyrrellensis]|uniref:Thioredoxin reductase n=1 Tax=Candidatus Halobonum tyrrellensis G22 TaxID=1324957 RepID=V4HNZ2_9EURY|nr:NAD(P)/FAD-dependent oxidoreductase [Candidatus Halobonum tyrrellensis]ESP89639.1 thioredoxin reductase [Candidatus Halobonum tyrrellensis G22]